MVTPARAFPWHLVLLAFIALVAGWIASGFVGIDVSLTVLFFPALLAALALSAGRRLISPPGIVILRSERPLAAMALAILLATISGWALGGLPLALPASARLFSVVVSIGVAALHIAIWITPTSTDRFRQFARVLLWLTVIDGIASIAIFVTFNLLRIIPVEVAYLNPRYPVILMQAAGQSMVRTPGLFESGGVNGTFLLLTAIPLLAWLLFAPASNVRRGPRWVAFIGLGTLVAMTLTRRSILALLVSGTVLLVWHAQRTGRFRYVIGLALLGVFSATGVLATAPELVRLHSFLERLDFWQQNVSDIFASRPNHLLTGFGVLQSGLRLMPGTAFRILDNTVLELLIFGGLPLLVAVHGYYLVILVLNLRLSRVLPAEDQWLAIAAVAFCVAAAVISLFAPFFFSVTESIPAMLAVNLTTKHLLGRVEQVRVSAAEHASAAGRQA